MMRFGDSGRLFPELTHQCKQINFFHLTATLNKITYLHFEPLYKIVIRLHSKYILILEASPDFQKL